jgi:hypothetical protein
MMARNDRDMPLAPSAAIVDEQTKRAAMRTSTPVRSTSPASVRRFDETGKGFAKPETKNTTVSTTSPASTRRFEETGAGFPKPVVQNVTGWVKAKTIQTASGPIDVDANGLAADGSTPTAITQTDEKDTITSEKSDAYQKLFDEFNALGLGALVEDGKDLLMKATSVSAMPEALRNTKAYMTRFSANDARIKAGFKALSPAAYLALEDQYQNVMREYGLPVSYYTPGLYGKQEGFEKLISNDVSNDELESRIMTAQERVIRGAPQIAQALKEFYPEITDGDILAYALDPANAIKNIQRKVTAAEIGGAALQSNLTTSLARVEELQKYGVDKAAATEGYSMISGGLQRGSELASIYGQDPYSQATAESEVFKLTGQQEARKQRQKVTGLEKATFGGQTGVTSGALARDRAGGI